jgi:hypothetical protein
LVEKVVSQGGGDGATQTPTACARGRQKIADIRYTFRGGHHTAAGHELSMLDDAQEETLKHPGGKDGLWIVRRKEFGEHLKVLGSKATAPRMRGACGSLRQNVVLQLVGVDHATTQPISDPAGRGVIHMELARVREVGDGPLLSRR